MRRIYSLKKNPELKKIAGKLGVLEQTDQRSNVALRKAIWSTIDDLQRTHVEIPLNKEDAKTILEQLESYFPIYALFRADRPSNDSDAEVQDPMKIAVRQAMAELKPELEKIKAQVEERTLEVASRTLDKLRDFDDSLANELQPTFETEPKWESIFKLSLIGDDKIPLNKRGSGVRRLVLLSFLRAEAERKLNDSSRTNIIYAIEEPETSQHPNNQKLVIKTLKDLSMQDGCQIILTTHVPALAGMVPVNCLRRIVQDDDKQRRVEFGTDEILQSIADDLGVFPDQQMQDFVRLEGPKVFVCVEGPTDVSFFYHVSRLFKEEVDNTLPCMETDPRIIILHLGGSALKDWVKLNYLKKLKLPEFHLYDRDNDNKYQNTCDVVNARNDGSQAGLTQKREMENYLHPDAIEKGIRENGIGVKVEVNDDDSVIEAVCRRKLEIRGLEGSEFKKGLKNCKERIKRKIADKVVPNMTVAMFKERDPKNEILGWLKEIDNFLK
ncbi:MAG TPA: hypothetical protein DCM38_06895 [Gammaproteobacteria bacterium]|nr:hypothetical protein [Gammaproteobacteria bacterium]